MPWKTLCGFPPTSDTVSLLIPNGAWRPDTVITDTQGNEYFALLEMDTSMRSYEAVFSDLDGRRLVCVKRHILKAFWKDGYFFCTYRPNYRGQKPYGERDLDGKKIYPHSYLELNPLKGRFAYRFVDHSRQFTRPRLFADNPWLGFMMGCCTCCMRCGKFTAKFKKRDQTTQVFVDQWRNTVKVAPNNDLLAALCMAYVFDKSQNQPMVVMYGADEEDYAKTDDNSVASVSSGEDDDDMDDDDDDEARDNVDQDEFDRKYNSSNYNNGNYNDKGVEMGQFRDDSSNASSQKQRSIFSNSKQPHPYHPAPQYSDARSVRSQQSIRSQHTHQSQRSHATLQSQRSHATQQSQRSHATQQSQRSHATQQSQRSQVTHQSHQTQQSQQSYQTQQSQRTNQTQQTQRSQLSQRSQPQQQQQQQRPPMSSNASVTSSTSNAQQQQQSPILEFV